MKGGMKLHHINIKAPGDLLQQEKDFFCSVLGLREGNRPDFSSRGYWLYAGDKAIVHLSESDSHFRNEKQGFFDHVAFQTTNLKQLIQNLEGRYENSAEHSWHVALMALLLEEHAPGALDMLKVTKLLLIHDVVEIDARDTWLYDENQDSRLAEESKAAHRLFSLLPANQKEEYLNLWIEFEDRASEEAKFAAVLDGIQPLLNHVITGNADYGVIPAEEVRSKKETIKNFAPKLWGLVEELINESESIGLYDWSVAYP